MPKIHVSRSVDIDAAASKIHPLLNDFNAWQKWSPWLLADPEAQVDVAPDGKSYRWEGPITGSGEMQILSESPAEIQYNLLFLKPFKSKAKTHFKIEPIKNGTRLTWVMDSSLPFFMFWMKRSMEVYIGMDYDRGLLMIKDLAEKGKVGFNLEFLGIQSFEKTAFISKTKTCPIDELPQHMSKDYEQLLTYAYGNEEVKENGAPFAQYHKWDPLKGVVHYTACVPVESFSSDLPESFETGHLPDLQVYGVRHKGSYKHLGNSWAAVMMHERGKKFKSHKKFSGMEVYRNSPQNTPENELVSEILIPVRN